MSDIQAHLVARDFASVLDIESDSHDLLVEATFDVNRQDVQY